MISQCSPGECGRGSYGHPKIIRWGSETKLKIGNYCSIADDVVILLGGEHHAEWITTFPFNVLMLEFNHISDSPNTKGDIIIGNDVWLGYGSIIRSGVTIGDGAVIGAGAVVAKDIEPYAIVAGNPVQLIRKRFDDETIKWLLEIKWWDWPEEKIVRFVPLMLSADIEKFRRAVEDYKT